MLIAKAEALARSASEELSEARAIRAEQLLLLFEDGGRVH
jgi:hypothetical protein